MMRRTPGTWAGPACGVGWRPILRSGGGGLGRGAVRGEEHRDGGDAGERGDGGLGGGAHRLELRPLGRVHLEQEAHPVALDGERAHEVGLDDAAAAAGHGHGAERVENVVTGHGHRVRPFLAP